MLIPVDQGHDAAPIFSGERLIVALSRVRERIHVVARAADGLRGVVVGDRDLDQLADGHATLGTLPELFPEWLGDRSFGETHGVRFPYVAGEMAFGISTTWLVIEMARAGMLGFFGAGGVDVVALERALDELDRELGGQPNWGVNLIHTPDQPAGEDRVADMLLRRRVPCISMSAFMDITPAVARCAASGLRQDRTGRIVRQVSVFAKVSRPDIAERFMSPPPADLLRTLVDRGQLTEQEARLATRVPVAEDITVEADSAGHTDNQSLVSVLPAVLAARNTLRRRHIGLGRAVRVGAAGGLGDPAGVAAAFAMGAAYVLTGSINQMSVEAGVSDTAKAMLAEADVTDVAMACSPQMFEEGARTQVLRRGTLFANRAARLHHTYRTYSSLQDIPARERAALERDVLGLGFDEVWALTSAHWRQRDPATVIRAQTDPKLRMALTFRWYLSESARWAVAGAPDRVADYQLWCGPAAGTFNRWTAGTFLADPAERDVVQIALNLMEGAAVLTRAQQLRSFGVGLPDDAFTFMPRRLRPPS